MLAASGDHSVELIVGAGGVFEIVAGGDLKFSKKATRRFPNDAEISEMLTSL